MHHYERHGISYKYMYILKLQKWKNIQQIVTLNDYDMNKDLNRLSIYIVYSKISDKITRLHDIDDPYSLQIKYILTRTSVFQTLYK